MRNLAEIVLFLTLTAGVGFAATAESFRIANARVVYADEYLKTGFQPWGRMAAVELAEILSKLTASEVKAFPESKAPVGDGRTIYVGPVGAAAALSVGKPDVFAFRVRVEPECVFLLGRNETSTSYAVTEFLESSCGYLFLTQNGQNPYVVNPSLAVRCRDDVFAPAIPYRTVYRGYVMSWLYGDDLPLTAANWHNFARQRRLCSRGEDHEQSHRVRRIDGTDCHLAYAFLPPENYFKEHPDWYSMDERGTRTCVLHGGGQLCYSNRAMRDEYAKNLLAMVEADVRTNDLKRGTVYDISQLDGTMRLCRCPECKKVLAKYAVKGGDFRNCGDSGLQLEFVNDIAARVAAKHPEVKLRVFAYVSTESVPEGLEVHPNVVIRWCDVYTWSDHMRPLSHPVNARNLEVAKGWFAKTKNIDIWDYMLDYTIPEVNAEALQADARLFRDLGARDIMMETGYHDQPFYDLHQYLFDKLYFNPDEDVSRLIDAYCTVYGKGAAKMREMIDFIMKLERETPPRSLNKWHIRELGWYTIPNFEWMHRLGDEAYALEADPFKRSRIAFVLSGIDNWLMEQYASLYGKDEAAAAARADYVRYTREWATVECGKDAKRRARVEKKLDDMMALDGLRFSDLPAGLEKVSAKELKCIDWRAKRFTPMGRFLMDDPRSESGKAVRYQPLKLPAFPFVGGVLDNATDKRLVEFDVKRPADLKEGEFRWFMVCTVTIGRDSAMWLFDTVQAIFKGYYVNCDGAVVDLNRHDIWVSLRFAGPTYFPGSKEPDAIFMDRVLLRRVK